MAVQFLQMTRAEIRERIGRLGFRGRYTSGLALGSPAPTSTTFALLSARPYPNHHFRGSMAYAVAGTGLGQAAYVADSAVGTGLLTITPSVSPTFDATTRLEIWPTGITPDDVNAQIDLAIDDVASLIGVFVETVSPVVDPTGQIITIPASYTRLVDVSYITSGATVVVFRYRFNPDLPRQEQGRDFTIFGGQVRLSEPIPSDATGVTIRGYRRPAHPTDDTTLVDVRPDFIAYKALALLEESQLASAAQDSEARGQRTSVAQGQAQIVRNEIRTDWLPNTVNLDYGGG